MTFSDSSSADVTQHFMKTTTLKKTTCFCSRLNVTESQLSCLSRRGMGNFHHCLIFWHCGTWKDKQVRSVWKPFLGGGLISRLDTMTRRPWRDSDAVWGWSTCERRSARSDRWCSVLRRHSVELFAWQNNKKKQQLSQTHEPLTHFRQLPLEPQKDIQLLALWYCRSGRRQYLMSGECHSKKTISYSYSGFKPCSPV